jgi:CrcB protein
MLNLLLIFAGGGLGSLCRYGTIWVAAHAKWHFPAGTLLANLLSCFLLGGLLAFGWKGTLTNEAKVFFITGFCGGFSTFSTFTGETYLLLQSGHWLTALLNIIGSIVVCMVALVLGIRAFS